MRSAPGRLEHALHRRRGDLVGEGLRARGGVPVGGGDPPAPQQRRRVDERAHAGDGRRGELAVVALAHRLGVADGQVVQRRVPGEVRAVRRGATALGDPVVEPDAAALVLAGLVHHVGLRVHGVTRGGLAEQRALGEQPGLVEAALVLPGEGEQRDVPPVVAVRRGEPVDQVPRLLLDVGDPGERDRRHRRRDGQDVARVVGDVVHQRRGALVAGVVDPTADDVHQAALALVAPLEDRAAGGLQRAGHVGRRPGLVAEHRQRGVGQREVGVERRRLAQQLLAAGLEAHHPLQAGVVARRRLGRRRQRQAEGVAGTGDGVVAADQPAVLEAARHRGDGVEHVDRQAERLAADLGDRGRLPELAAPQRAQRPHGCVRPAGRVEQPSVAGPEAHPGRGRLRQGDAAAHGEEVVEHGVAEAAYVEGGTGAVDHPADVVGRAVGEGDPQPAAGERRRVGDGAGAGGAAGRRSPARAAPRPRWAASGDGRGSSRWRRWRGTRRGRPRTAVARAR